MNLTYVALTAGALLSTSVMAQNTQEIIQRDVNQEKRIEQGLKSGELTTKEAAKLERDESRVDKMESKALSDGKLSNAEKRRIEQEQNKVSKEIHREKHDAQTADPNSTSSKRMQADVQRNVNQQERIEQGGAIRTAHQPRSGQPGAGAGPRRSQGGQSRRERAHQRG